MSLSEKNIEIIKRSSKSEVALIAGWIIIFGVYKIIIDSIILEKSYLNGILLGILMLLWAIGWFINAKRFSRASKNKVGIILSLEFEKDGKVVRDDYISQLKKEIINSKLYDVEIVGLDNVETKRANKIINLYTQKQNQLLESGELYKKGMRIPNEFKQFAKLVKKTRGYFFIWGKVVKREKYFIDMEAVIIHKPVKIETHNKLINEFRNVFPKEISFYEKMEFQNVKLSTNYIVIGIKYITGIAALVSYDYYNALKIHKDVYSQLKREKNLPPNLVHVVNELKGLISEELYLIAKYHTEQGNQNKSNELIEEALQFMPKNYDVLILKSYIEFVQNNNDETAMNFIKKAEKVKTKDYTWMYNKGFILMYQQHFKLAYECYKKLSKKQFDGERYIQDQVINFITKYIEENNNDFQFIFTLGYLYYKKVEPPQLGKALENFELFLQKASQNKDYDFLVEKAETFCREVKDILKI